jgi:hypothetical protein
MVLSTEELEQERKLIPAKAALGKIIRAIKEQDYGKFNSDDVTEVQSITPVVPEMAQYH